FIENAMQGTARDLFAAGLQRLEAAGYPIVCHTHDEAVAEVPEGFGSKEEFNAILAALSDWAEGLPVAAKVREGPRFCKLDRTVKEDAPIEADRPAPEPEVEAAPWEGLRPGRKAAQRRL